MSDHFALVKSLCKHLEQDRISLSYHGKFDDTFTDKLISIIEYDLEKKAKKRIALLVSESFQNIVRHGSLDHQSNTISVFNIRAINQFAHIFSYNLVDGKTKEFLEKKIGEINGLNKDEIRTYYTEALEKGTFNSRGGAGLGFIEMARKSERPIQKKFQELNKDVFAFYMQVDMQLIETENQQLLKPLPITNNCELHKLIADNQVIFLFKGDFGTEIINPMLNIMKENTQGDGKNVGYQIFHAAVELMQNITKHGKEIEGKKEGIFILNKTEKGYRLSTGNYTEGNTDYISGYLAAVNAKSTKEIYSQYKEQMLKNTLDGKENNQLGFLDIKKNNTNPLEFTCTRDTHGNFIIISIEINAESF